MDKKRAYIEVKQDIRQRTTPGEDVPSGAAKYRAHVEAERVRLGLKSAAQLEAEAEAEEQREIEEIQKFKEKMKQRLHRADLLEQEDIAAKAEGREPDYSEILNTNI